MLLAKDRCQSNSRPRCLTLGNSGVPPDSDPSTRADNRRLDAFEFVVLFAVVLALGGIKFVAHNRFGTSFDSALFGNVAWRLGSGLDSVSTLTGYQYFATHASVVILLLAPVFALSPEAGMLLTFSWQSLSIGLVGLAVCQIGRTFSLSTRSRHLLLILTALSPGAFLATRLDVHEPTLGLGFLAMTLSSGLANSTPRKSWWWPVLGAACRIEMAVAIVLCGLLVLGRHRSRKVGYVAIASGVAGISFSLWFMAGSGTEAASVAAHFSHLGSTAGEVIGSAILNPLKVIQPLADPEMLSSVLLWLLPAGVILPLIGWRYLLVALPLAVVAIFGVWPPADQFPHHYWYGFIVAAPIAAAAALRRRPQLERSLLMTGATGFTIAWMGLLTAMPILQPFGRADTAAFRDIIQYVAANEPLSVSALDGVLPHLVGRAEIFGFPRPFLCSEGGVGPFAWSGKLPEAVLVRKSDVAAIDSDPKLGPVLSQFYSLDAGADLIAPFRLRDSRTSVSGCV